MKGFIVLLIFLFASLYMSCNTDKMRETNTNDAFQFKGLITKQGITTYMYGTHVISDERTTYALKSDTINLDAYIGKNVTVKGAKMEGYPLDGGPEFINVKSVE